MANVAVTFDADEHIKHNFEQVCESLGMKPSTGFNILMKVAIRERNLLLGDTDSFQMDKVNYQRQQQKAALAFIDTVNAAEDELTSEDYEEFENGKYKAKFNRKAINL